MKLLIFVLLAVAYISAKRTDADYHRLFRNFVQEYKSQYTGAQEFFYRYRIFKQNVDFIDSHNQKNSGMVLAINEFADLTSQEFYSKFLRPISYKPVFGKTIHHGPRPNDVNWVDQGAVTEVRHQGSCGSCWAFSTCGAMEGAWKISQGELEVLSPQHLVDCCNSCHGCQGGYITAAFQCAIDQGGMNTEECYPYQEQQGTCQPKEECKKVKISSYEQVTSGDEGSLADAVGKCPVAVAIDASNQSFQFYHGGIYEEPNCSTSQLNHAVLAVGYNDGEKYWLIKNSWGSGWGEGGYLKLPKDKENYCGVATDAAYPVV